MPATVEGPRPDIAYSSFALCKGFGVANPRLSAFDHRKHRMPNDNDTNPSRRGPLVALGVVVVLFVVGWLLAHELYANGKLEDCLMSGRTNCAPIDTQSR
jgi:hypothetical protein